MGHRRRFGHRLPISSIPQLPLAHSRTLRQLLGNIWRKSPNQLQGTFPFCLHQRYPPQANAPFTTFYSLGT